MAKIGLFGLLMWLPLLIMSAAWAQVTERAVAVYSEGVRLHGAVFSPLAVEGRRHPAVVMSHGWGGTAALLRPQAEDFARAGFFVLAIDYRGWGDSDARWVRGEPSGVDNNERRPLREVVDPIDQATDLMNAVHWVMGEPGVDPARVGLWGTSFSGGLAVYVAAREPRIKAVVSQVAWFGQPIAGMPAAALALSRADATRRARGEIGYPGPSERVIGNLRGAPISEGFLRYAPIDDVPHMKHSALLIIDAEREELFNIRDHGQLAHERAAQPKKYVLIPGIAHYGIYGDARPQATDLAIQWFTQHLK